MANWVDLPKDVLETISNFCIIPDQIRMQSPCKSWRSILKYGIPRELPWLMTLPNNNSSSSSSKEEEEEGEENPPPDADTDARLFYSLSKQNIHTIPLPEIRGKRCCGSFENGWLMMVDDKFNIFLFHPWSKRKFDLPHQSTLKDQNIELGISPFDETHYKHIVRSAMADDGNAVVVVLGNGDLAFCRVGDAAYTYIDSGIDALIEDVIYHKGQFYVLGQVGAVYLLHIEEGFPPRGEKLTYDLDSPVCCYSSLYGYLAPDILTDSMFVITREVNSINQGLPVHKTIHFDIYSLFGGGVT
ncbi:hypothetical protein MRB53_023082 [Persea americana]|uniref:Uncharacterized protein n=1 Tax=Persea americana TaxID=3435 RepID=A0ACC2L9P0_PERAE|nr:hypothetical protein MRB53_023082 [Persea americana]